MNQKKKSFLKKSTAAAAAAILCVSAAPASVFAADVYTETAKTSISKIADSFAEDYQKSFDEYEAVKGAQTGNWTLTLGETSIALLGQLLGSDISWFQNIKIAQNQGISDNGTYINMDLMVNDSKICTLEMLVDTSSNVYMRIPELSPAYLSVSSDQMEEASGSLSKLNADILEYMPEASVVKDFLNKYGAMLLSHMEDQESSAETLTVEGVSLGCTMLEGTLTQEQMQETLADICTSVKEDEQVKSILDTFSQFTDGEDLYASVAQAADEILEGLDTNTVPEDLKNIAQAADELTEEAAELTEEIADDAAADDSVDTEEDVIILDDPSSPMDQILNTDGAYLSAKMWVNENDEIVGQQFAFCSPDGESVPFLTYQAPSAEGKAGLLFSISDGEEGFSFGGFGDITDNRLSGTYTLAVNDTPVLSVAVSDYLTDSAETEKSAGTYTLSVAPWSEALAEIIDETTYGFISTFAVTFAYNSEGNAGGFDLSLSTSGMNLGTLSMTAAPSDAELAIPDPSTFETVYRADSDEDMEAYLSTADMEALMNNAVNAGVPEEFIAALFAGGSEEDEYYDDEYYDDEYSEDAYEEPAA